MTKIRVLQFITPAGFYGAERWVIALANNTNYEKVVCDLAVTHESESQDLSVAKYYPEEAGQVHYLKMSGRFDFRVVSQLVQVIQERKIDVIHTHGYKSDILGLLAARKAGIKCVSTPHGFSGEVGFKLGLFIKLGCFSLRFFDAVVPLSEELMEDMKRLKVPENKTKFIRNGVDLKEIDEALKQIAQKRSELSLAAVSPENSIQTIGFIGQLIPRKGVGDLISVFDRLNQLKANTRLQLLGDGNQRSELEKQASKLASKSAIEFLGFRSDRLEILSSFSVFVMTSSLEGIPRCMMEAMAVGIPVVAYDIPGVDQLVTHGETGLLAPYGDQESLFKCIQTVLDDPILAAKLVAAGRAKVDEYYSGRRMAEEYYELFNSLLNK